MLVSTKAMIGLAAAMGATGAAGTAITERLVDGSIQPSYAVLLISLTVTVTLLGTCFGFIKWVLRNQGIYEPLTKLLTERLRHDAETDESLAALSAEIEKLRRVVEQISHFHNGR